MSKWRVIVVYEAYVVLEYDEDDLPPMEFRGDLLKTELLVTPDEQVWLENQFIVTKGTYSYPIKERSL